VIGQNYAGKSAVFDFLRFGLGTEVDLPEDSRLKLWDRLRGILHDEGTVEAFVRSGGQHYVVRRTFRPLTQDRRGKQVVVGCDDDPAAYRFDADRGDFEPAQDFSFPLEVYEQGRISRLRDDVQRQLEMLDEFAQLGPIKQTRDRVLGEILQSGLLLKPLYEQQEELKTNLADLPTLESELKQKEKLIPDSAEDQKWAASDGIVDQIEAAIANLRDVVDDMPTPLAGPPEPDDDAIVRLFGQRMPLVDQKTTAEPQLLTSWASTVKTAVDAIERARQSVVDAVTELEGESTPLRQQWAKSRKLRHDKLRAQLAKANVESPTELTRRVRELRQAVTYLKTLQQPKLAKLQKEIRRREEEHAALVKRLSELDSQLTLQRTIKAQELTDGLGDQIRVTLLPAEHRDEYDRVLDELCTQITNRESKILDRKAQLRKISDQLTPLELADALIAKGTCTQPDGTTIPLHQLCDVTENTQNVLCRIADDIELLTRLQTVTVADVPNIEVRRRGEHMFANLVSGLSQGEQSAAILTMALQTRRRPLVVDQPEDELGYNYVVHLVVPKILETKGARQILVITHNANVPVLGDADFVLKMENQPLETGGRRCFVEHAGCFESAAITYALMELDGGRQAFEFRQYRYALPR
jgi:hypothetical protein